MVPQAPDWRRADDYAWLERAETRSFAWEWLRRSRPYREAWDDRHGVRANWAEFGLVQGEDPGLNARLALPIWDRAVDPFVPYAVAVKGRDSPAAFDVGTLAAPLKVVRVAGREHVRLGCGLSSVRFDVHRGSVLAGPVVLHWRLAGVAQIGRPLKEMERLASICAGAAHAGRPVPRAARHVEVLRAFDALEAGASLQDMARIFHGALVPAARWRIEAPSLRLRMQRLARLARDMGNNPLANWFGA